MPPNKVAINAFIQDFLNACLAGPLYAHVDVPAVEGHPVDRLFDHQLQFDGYCVHCRKTSTFRQPVTLEAENDVQISDTEFPEFVLTFFKSTFACARDATHLNVYFWQYISNKLIKVGQSPSLESIAGNDIQQYRKVLGQQYFSELHRATGLASHGIGIGSFVYLRRIFERLIAEHRTIKEHVSGPIEGFDGLRMAEKIETLSAELPKTVVKYKAVYGILSKGIHELTETECKEYFPIVKAAIIAILEQDLQNRLKREKEDAIEKEMSRIASTMGHGAGKEPT